MKHLIIILCLVPQLCFGQKDHCKEVEKLQKDDGSIVYKSPKLKDFTLVKELSPASFFLLIHLYLDYAEEVGYGVEILLDDGTVLQDEKKPIVYQAMETQVNSTIMTSGAFGNGYVWQSLFRIDDNVAELLSEKRIVKVRLHSVTKKISTKEADKLKEFVSCMTKVN